MSLSHNSIRWYLRNLSPADQRDLESYFRLLRNFYGLYHNTPVFPKPLPGRRPEPNRPTPDARNQSHHPWRARLIAKGGQP